MENSKVRIKKVLKKLDKLVKKPDKIVKKPDISRQMETLVPFGVVYRRLGMVCRPLNGMEFVIIFSKCDGIAGLL